MAILSSDRTVIIGKTGSGKSYLSRYLVYPLPRLIVCDSKGQIKADEWLLEEYTESKFRQMVRNPAKNMRLRIKPPKEGERDWLTHLRQFMQLRNCVIQIDELNQLGAVAKNSDELRSLFTRGRELGLGVQACTQRPAWIPRESLTEAEHYIIFKVKDDDDNDRVLSFVGRAGQEELERWGYESFVDFPKYQFMYYNEDEGYAEIKRKVNITVHGEKLNV